MAYCPKCKGEMAAMETVCPHCGYDFPVQAARREGIAYSRLADIALLVCTIVSGIGCVVVIFAVVAAILEGHLLIALIVGPIVFLEQLGLFVVFVRIQDV